MNNGMNLGQRIKDLALRIVKKLSSNHGDIELDLQPVGRMGIMKIKVNKADMPRVLGASGANLYAITKIIETIGEKHGVPIKVQLLEPTKGERKPMPAFKPLPHWPEEEITAIVQDAASMAFKHPVVISKRPGKDFSTIYTINVSEQEPVGVVEGLAEPFTNLLNSIGKANGRYIYVDIAHPSADNPLNQMI